MSPAMVAAVIPLAALYVSGGVSTVLLAIRRGIVGRSTRTDADAAVLVTLLFALWPLACVIVGWVSLGAWARKSS